MEKDREENLYNNEDAETSLDDDEISPEEEAFMHGYNEALDEKKKRESTRE